ncbi:MAG: hypothetical protein ACOCWC_06145 [Bacteroidota bacterium]
MPVLGGGNKEQYRRPMGDGITKELRNSFGDSNVLSPNQVITVLNENDLTEEYSKAVENYTTTGIVPKEMVEKLNESLSVRYLLYTRLLADSEIGITGTGNYSKTYQINELYVQCQVWDAKVGDVVWEGKGGIAKLERNEDDVLKLTCEGLVTVIGNEKNEGPCKTKSNLVEYINQANTKSILAGTLVGTAAGLLLVMLMF